jgi:signal transduction histidine kinase
MPEDATRPPPSPLKRAAIVCVPAAVTLALDLAAPGELDLSAFYAVSIVACGWLRSQRLVWIATGVFVLLAFAGLGLGTAPIHADTWTLHIANRCFSVFGLLVLAWIVHMWVRSSEEREESRAFLARQLVVQREFIADAAHELRTPLAILRARIDMIGDEKTAEPLRRDVDTMGRTVAQLLDIAEMEGLRVDEAECADLQRLAAETVAHVAPLALARRRDIELSGAEGPVWVRGNAEALSRAVRNLVENAIHHTPEGTTVSVDVDDAGIVRVSDRGPGVPYEDRELIFRRFWRRDRRRTGNAGLGLSIVARVVEAHGGSIAVGDREGGGAVFAITLQPPTPRARTAESGQAQDPGGHGDRGIPAAAR